MAAWSIKKWRLEAIAKYGKARGLTKAQRDTVTKAVRGSKSTSKSSKTTKKKTKTKKRRNPVAKKKKNRKSRQMTVPIAIVAPIIGNLMWAYQSHDKWAGRLNLVSALYTGYDPGLQKFRVDLLKQGLGSLILGALIHKFVGGAPLNLNRMLGAAKVPFIRI